MSKYELAWSKIVCDEMPRVEDFDLMYALVDKETPYKPIFHEVTEDVKTLGPLFKKDTRVERCKCGNALSRTQKRCDECGQLLDRSNNT